MSEKTNTVLQMGPDQYDRLSTALLGLRQTSHAIRGYLPAHMADRLESLIDQASRSMEILEVVKEGPEAVGIGELQG